VSVCRIIFVSLQPVWPIVIYFLILLHVPLQCRTETLRFPYLSVCMQQPYYVLFHQARHRTVRFHFITIVIININNWTSLILSVSRVTNFLANVPSVFQLFSFFVACSGMMSTGFGFVAFFASLNASSVCIDLSCLVCL